MSKKPLSQISAYSNRGQGVILVLYTLHTLGGSNRKREVIDYISRYSWYDVTRHDLPPYKNQNEPKYHTLLAWARKDCYERDWLIPTDCNDDWSISRNGQTMLDKNIKRYQTGELTVRKCYLWKPVFKKIIDPNYMPSSDDAIRPEEILQSLFD
jgi:hypothetical protein